MREKKRYPFLLFWLMLGLVCSLASIQALAQERAAPPPYVTITGTAVSSPPLVDLHVLGLGAQGDQLDLSEETLTVTHNGVPVSPVEVNGRYKAGTFTLFLIDIPPGVSDQLPAIQKAIEQFAADPTMEETVDALAVYKVGETAAAQLLAPETFHNGVRNLFATPLTPELGATALVDSLGGLLEQIEGLKPNPDMAPAIVVMTDGTDVISTRFDENEIAAQAASLGIPIHTIWLTNENLSPASQQFGQDYLAQVAAGSRGLTTRLQDADDLMTIWRRIASLREQLIVSYPVTTLSGGDYPVTLSLEGSLVVRAETTVSVPDNLPMITINLPPESRELSLPTLDNPVKLNFSTSLSWLDDQERNLAAAQLLVNGMAYDVPINETNNFEVELNNLVYNANTVQMAVLDTQGLRVTSPIIELAVNEGGKSIPPELEGSSGLMTIVGRALLLLLAVVGLGVAVFFAWRQGWLSNLPVTFPRGPSRPRPQAAEVPPTKPVIDPITIPVIAHLEVLEAVTQTAPSLPLDKTVVNIGRSPAQAEIAFENDITVSRKHASLHLEGHHYRIFDERSTSGTWVNDQQVPEYGIQLMDGDEIHMGAVHLRYRQP